MSQLCKVSFDVTGSFQQELSITADDETPESLIKKLNSGDCMTTLEVVHADLLTLKRTVVKFDEEGNEVTVAEILSQVSGGETVYTDFQLESLD
jgi:hypothetical protein